MNAAVCALQRIEIESMGFGIVRAIYEASEGEDSAPDPLGGGTNEKIDINYLRGARMIKIKRFHSTRRSLVDNVTGRCYSCTRAIGQLSDSCDSTSSSSEGKRRG